MNALERLLDPRERPDDPPDERPAVLRRFLEPRPAAPPGETCEYCATDLGTDHRHVVDIDRRSLQCACRGCALLFTQAGAAGGRYRTVPDDYRRLEPFVLDPGAWQAMQIPVGMAFFMISSPLERTIAFYPSPAGATESALTLDSWQAVVDANPPLGELEPDVEAALIRSDRRDPGGVPRAYLVPIDRCYELVGELRLHWRGFDGGQEVRDRIDAFFVDLDARARLVGGGP